MTESTFIDLHFTSGELNKPHVIHLNVNEVENTTPRQGVIKSLIVSVDAFSINGQSDNTYIEGILEQIETVRFTFEEIVFSMNILSKTYYPARNPFFYFVIDPVYIPNIDDADIFESTIKDITFTPFLQDMQFGFSEYNPLISNAELNRKSNTLMTSDKSERTNTPVNIDALLNLTADKASIQDSMYSDTGWINARYNGSKTSALESAGIAPTIVGRTFVGEIFSSDSDTDYICALENRVKQELFHTSETELPTFTLSDLELTLTQPFGSGQTKIRFSTNDSSDFLSIGDVLVTFRTYFQSDPIPEYVRIVSISKSGREAVVVRDIYKNWTTLEITDFNIGTVFTKVNRFDIFRFGTGQNRIQLVNNSRIYVEGNSTIVDTDDFGLITSSSQCPYIGYIVDQT